MMIFMMKMMVLLARIWESKVREEKKENADEKDKTKQTTRNQFRFSFHLWVLIFMYDRGDHHHLCHYHHQQHRDD